MLFFLQQSTVAAQVQEHIGKAEASFEKRDYRTVSHLKANLHLDQISLV